MIRNWSSASENLRAACCPEEAGAEKLRIEGMSEEPAISEKRPPAGIKSGAMVVVVLHSPREKCWGVLDRVSAAGVFLRGLDLGAFDDWTHAVARDEPFIGLTDLFFPMWRVERIARDE